MQAQQIPTEWAGPEESRDLIDDALGVLQEHVDLLTAQN